MNTQEQPSGFGRLELSLGQVKASNSGALVHGNAGASLVDLGDGILCLEFHSKANTLDGQVFEIMEFAWNELAKDWLGLVIGNEGTHFSAGANLGFFADCIERRAWGEMEQLLIRLQSGLDIFRYSNKPVVAAPFGMTLGGGCEVAMASTGICAALDSRMGQIEARVGLVPTLGGCMDPLRRRVANAEEPLNALKDLFFTLALGKISVDAEEARSLGFLLPTDRVIPAREGLIGKAKEMVRYLGSQHANVASRKPPVWAAGSMGLSLLKESIFSLQNDGLLAGHACTVAEKLAVILTGGGTGPERWVDPQFILDLEREAFMSLLGHPLGADRIMHTLKTGTILNN